jgi:hypothetical protein
MNYLKDAEVSTRFVFPIQYSLGHFVLDIDKFHRSPNAHKCIALALSGVSYTVRRILQAPVMKGTNEEQHLVLV